MSARVGPVLATCIGCGCDDDHACKGGCSWLRVDYVEGLGVCSRCPDQEARWDRGDHSFSATVSRLDVGDELDLDSIDDDLVEEWSDDPGIILPGSDNYDDTLAELRRR